MGYIESRFLSGNDTARKLKVIIIKTFILIYTHTNTVPMTEILNPTMLATAMPVNDGRKSMEQEIEHVRRNNPDVIAGDGEFYDNEVGWGKATQGGSLLTKDSLVYFGNGLFAPDIFDKMWTQRKDPTMRRYDENDVEKLGKFNAGSTESVYLNGNKGTTYHNFGGIVHKTVLDLKTVIETNNIPANSCPASVDEVKKFVDYMRRIVPDYDLETHKNFGTVTVIEDLLRHNDKARFEDTRKFLYGLFHETRTHKCTYTLFNEIGKPVEPIVIEPTNMGFGATPIATKWYVYPGKKSKEREFRKSKKKGVEPLYTVTHIMYFQSEEHMVAEKKVIGTNGDERTGFHFYRGGRKTSGIMPKRFNIGFGMGRARGIRNEIHFPVNKTADDDTNIGTFKKITDDSWGNFDPTIQKFLTERFKESFTKQADEHKDRQTVYTKKYEEKMKLLSEQQMLSKEELTKEYEKEKKELETQLKSKEVLKKRNGLAYDAHNNYLKQLMSIIKESIPSQNKISAPEPGHDGPAPEPGHDGPAPEPGHDGPAPEPDINAPLQPKETKPNPTSYSDRQSCTAHNSASKVDSFKKLRFLQNLTSLTPDGIDELESRLKDILFKVSDKVFGSLSDVYTKSIDRGSFTFGDYIESIIDMYDKLYDDNADRIHCGADIDTLYKKYCPK